MAPKTGNFSMIDLFCGVGGLTLGFKSAKYDGFSFKVIAAVDSWKRAAETYKANHPEVEVIHGDIRDRQVKDRLVRIAGGHIDVVVGGPPCEAFSLAGKRDPNDPRAKLFYDYIDIVNRLQPYMFVMENVKGIFTMLTFREDMSEEVRGNVIDALNKLLDLKNVGRKRRAAPQYIVRNNMFKSPEEKQLMELVKSNLVTAPEAIRQAFDRIGYDVKPNLLNAADYGVPQERERAFFIGAKRSLRIPIRFHEPTHSKTPSHTVDGKVMKPWITLKDAIGDLPPFEERKNDEVFEGSFSPIFMSRNRWMNWEKPSYTILASARHILLHPSSPRMVKKGKDKWAFVGEGKPRRLSVRECARIQTFPDWYRFAGNNVVDKYALIGDAVPPLLATRTAESVLESLVGAGINPSM